MSVKWYQYLFLFLFSGQCKNGPSLTLITILPYGQEHPRAYFLFLRFQTLDVVFSFPHFLSFLIKAWFVVDSHMADRYKGTACSSFKQLSKTRDWQLLERTETVQN